MYNSSFSKKEFDEHVLGFIQDKVDHLWQNYPTEFKTSYNDFYHGENREAIIGLEG